MRVLVIVDVSNLYYSIANRFNGRKLDYTKLYQYCVAFGEIYRAVAYGAAMGTEADAFKLALESIGFEPKYKEPKVYPTDVPGKEIRKADWDVGMAMDVVRMIDSVDIVILCTGDGDLTPCAEWIESKGKRTIVVGCGISKELRDHCHYFQEITGDMLEPYKAERDLDVRTDSPSHAVRQTSS